MNKKFKVLIISLLFLIILLLIIFYFYSNNKSPYSNKVNNIFINYENYVDNNYDDYVRYYEENNDIDKAKIINFINFCNNSSIDCIQKNHNLINLYQLNDFKIDNIDRYMNYINNKNTVDYEKVIKIVNNNLDNIILNTSSDIEDFVLSLVNEKYFKSSNLERYINYYLKSNNNLSAKDVVVNVNSYLDYNFYDNYQNTDVSKDILMIVNKHYSLSSTYVPQNLITVEPEYGYAFYLRSDVYEAFKEMYVAAQKDNIQLFITSPYRSYENQKQTYNSYVNTDGIAKADTYSARPGFSEHQTGLAMDLTPAVYMDLDTFENSPSFPWMLENAHKYGFILRYPKDKEYITGYIYEPWHYRYVGVEAATVIKNENLTFEEYYEYYVNN